MSPEEKLSELLSAIPGVSRVEVAPFTAEQQEKVGAEGKRVTCFLSTDFLPPDSLTGVARGQLLLSNTLLSDESAHGMLVDNMLATIKRYHPLWTGGPTVAAT